MKVTLADRPAGKSGHYARDPLRKGPLLTGGTFEVDDILKMWS